MLVDPAFVVPLALLGAFLLACTGLVTRLGLAYGKVHESVVLSFIGSVGVLTLLLLLVAWPATATPRALGLFALDGLCGALAVILLYTGVARIGPSISYALKSTAPLTAVVLATFVLHEVEPWPVYLGALLAVLGVGLLSIQRLQGELVFNRQILFPLAGASFFGTANILRRSAMPEVSSPLVGVTLAMIASLLVALVWMALRRQRPGLNRGTPHFLLAGALQAGGLLAVYTALVSGHVAVVVPLYTSSPLFVLALSPLVLGRLERLTPGIVLGSLTVLAGVALITTAS